jgi:hypothetical protein
VSVDHGSFDILMAKELPWPAARAGCTVRIS